MGSGRDVAAWILCRPAWHRQRRRVSMARGSAMLQRDSPTPPWPGGRRTPAVGPRTVTPCFTWVDPPIRSPLRPTDT